MKIPYQNHSRGVALIVALAFIVIVSVLVVGLSETLRTERSAVRTHLERQRATTMAQHGTDLVMSRLQQYTVDAPRASGESEAALDRRTRHWVSQPGRLLVANPLDLTKPKQIEAEVSLSSGLPDARLLNREDQLADFFPPNLNEALLLEPETHLITEELAGGGMAGDEGATENAATVQMPVRWIYVRKDGTTVRKADDSDWEDIPDATDQANPLIGRFAFWADDESTKVNYNLAWTRDGSLNRQPPGHPTRIDLRALRDFSSDAANELHSFVTRNEYRDIGRFFNTPFDARFIASPALLKALNSNRFNLTHYNHEPDTTYYGRSRMVLTTQLSNAALRDKSGALIKDPQTGKARTRPFLDILTRSSEMSTTYVDPGFLASIDPKKLGPAVQNLVDNYLKKNDWPMADGHSIQEKYYGSYSGVAREQRLAQLALNIIDYVRSVESAQTIVEPIRGKYVNGQFIADFFPNAGGIRGDEDTFKGLVRAPYITEMAVWQSNVEDPGKGFRTIAFAEVFLPRNYGIEQLDLREWQLYFLRFGELPVAQRTVLNPTPPSFAQSVFVLEAVGNPAKNIMLPGEYRMLCYEMWKTKLGTTPLRAAITKKVGSLARIDVAPIGDPDKSTSGPKAQPLNYAVQPANTFINIRSFETADPRVNGVAADWKLSTRNTFGAVNTAWLTSVGQIPQPPRPNSPEQDTDRNGRISEASLRMSFPFKKGDNLSGRVRSSGELGIIHTGIEGSSLVENMGVRGGTPWRTLRLQPSNSATVMPDWAFMDLFTPPVDVPVKAAALFAPHGTSAGGRVNMNANPEPFSQSEYKLVRTEPLAAVLHRSRKNSVDPSKLVSEGDAKTLARNIYDRVLASKGKEWGSKNFPCYESPGEVVEIKGIADEGEESEELVREIANLITARGNTFAVYSIGQSLQQSPNGRLTVTAEQRQHVLVERYTNDKNEVHLGTVYFRNLIP
jgi:hypothetical protein